MIVYYKGAFNLNLLTRIHGSAMYRASFYALLSVGVFLWMDSSSLFSEDFNHPAPVSVLVSSISLLFVFRANFGYNRYWEACGDTFGMLSKWLDASIHTACYHLQCDFYNEIKPPSYYNYPHFNHDNVITRDRRQAQAQEQQQVHVDMNSILVENSSVEQEEEDAATTPWTNRRNSSSRKPKRQGSSFWSLQSSSYSIQQPSSTRIGNSINSLNHASRQKVVEQIEQSHNSNSTSDVPARRMTGKTRLDGGWKGFYENEKATHYGSPERQNSRSTDHHGFASIQGGATPPLFLQELAHLTSLLSAVALSTLRNDVDGAESPLIAYTPGTPWPPVDSSKRVFERQDGHCNTRVRDGMDIVLKWLGMDRTPQARTRFNSQRPLQVLGGVSHAEVLFLQAARGPAAKVQLAFSWLSTFVESEHLAGSMGNVESAILSRVMQFLGDGMLHYNEARQVMFVPFPFVHAQLSVWALFVLVVAVPMVLVQYANETWLGCVLVFCTMVCLGGLHEVARELENPFRNVPNDVPVMTLQAMLNEALITMYAGYHPDAYFVEEQQQPHDVMGLRRCLYKRDSGSIRLQRQDYESDFHDSDSSSIKLSVSSDVMEDYKIIDHDNLLQNEKAKPTSVQEARRTCMQQEEEEIRKLRKLITQQTKALQETNLEIERLIQLVGKKSKSTSKTMD